MSTYYVIRSQFGHLCLTRRESARCSLRIHGEKPWGGGTIIKTFRSRSDTAAIKRYGVKS